MKIKGKSVRVSKTVRQKVLKTIRECWLIARMKKKTKEKKICPRLMRQAKEKR